MDFFNGMGFRLPARKDPASFLQEVTSVKDQQVYCCDCIPISADPYGFSDFVISMRTMHYEALPAPCLAQRLQCKWSHANLQSSQLMSHEECM